MTQRERMTSAGVTEAEPANGHEAPPRPPATNPPTRTWEEMFGAATPERQREWLALARQQGVLFVHQIQDGGNGKAPHGPAPLAQLLAGTFDHLEPVYPGPLSFFDPQLDDGQREAVARAVHAPDLCVIQGLPGTGKTRVVIETLLQAVARGERVLLIGHSSAAIDRILERVGTQELLCPVRCLCRDERPDTLAPAARGFTFDERLRALREPAQARARHELETAEVAAQRIQQCLATFERLEALLQRASEIERQLAALVEKQSLLPGQVDQETTAESCAELASATAVRAGRLTPLAARQAELELALEQLRQQQAEVAPRIRALTPLVENKRRRRWWTADWWRLTFRPARIEEFAALETEAGKIETELASVEHERQQLNQDRASAEQEFQAVRERIVAAEVTRRRYLLAGEESALRQEQTRLQEQWDAACREQELRPLDRRADALGEARELRRGQCQQAEQRRDAARQWLAFVEQESGTLATRLLDVANPVVATISAFAHDEQFGNRPAGAAPFDLLIVLEAQRATRADLQALTRRARRCVLVGEPELAETRPSNEPPQAGLFASLWKALAPHSTRPPVTWTTEKDRLCCRLRAVAAEQRQWLQNERLVDRPEIELRILAQPRAQPMLAEIVFPPTTTVAKAKEFIFRELEEVALCTPEALPRWSECDGKVVLSWGQLAAKPEGADLGGGVREILGPALSGNGDGHPKSAWQTHRLEFAGWPRAKAEAWLQRHLGLRDFGRAAQLDVPHRMGPALAGVLADLLFPGGYRIGPVERNGSGPVVEFVCVGKPSRAGEPNGRGSRRNGSRPPQPTPLAREGAGLEIELAERRHLDRLPAELRVGLPDKGIVNYSEAQAVVRMLPSLAGAAPSSVAVLALYRAQAELIQRLAAQCPALAKESAKITVTTPELFRQSESDVVLVSLTRSHLHRAVTFGAAPQSLAHALTRARTRLVLFGDSGTLIRRSQWEGPLDHLDEAAAARERAIIARLVRYLEGQGSCQHVFGLQVGSSV
ncbi:hypothetical protein AYO40_02845 [Planctomycetaceae bacterium SCGC AG-212-D15]|nr:hypothetical protein AYO40_02845 [Planctomycetaceae bacterium SCGC AG-212-D15]